MSTVRIAYVIDYVGSLAGGTESQLLTLIRGLDRDRFEPRVYLLRRPDVLSTAVPTTPVTTVGIGPVAYPSSLKRLLAFARSLKADEIKLAHLYFPDTSIALPWMLHAAGLPVVVSRRDLGFWYSRRVLFVLRLQRFAVSAVVANCAAVRNRVVKAEGFDPSVVHVISNGKNTDEPPLSREAAREKLGVSKHAAVLLVVANFRPLKRLEDAVAALPSIRARFPSAELILVGSDYYEGGGPSPGVRLRDLAQRLGVKHALRVAGEIPDPRPYMAAADVCLLCSETEGLSNSILEYMLAARPTIATRVGGNPELIQDGVTGTLVDVGRPDQIAAAAIAYLENPGRAKDVGITAREWVVANFSIRSMVDAHVDLYDRVLQGRMRA
jgi:glycosyltransferase involved in cell wall biosynthesis